MPETARHTAGRATEGPARSPRQRQRQRQRGQVVVIFAGAMLALLALCAVVVDVAWYWTTSLHMQRAADAAALAGVVWLPGNVATARTTARAEAAKNGYTDGVDGVVVTPEQDASNPRRLRVAISGPVGTFFARAIGIDSWPAARTAKADYVLPVPMGSPQNYYGVGFYEGRVAQDVVTPGYSGNSGNRPPTVAPTSVWLASSGDLTSAVAAADGSRAYTTTNGQAQQWSAFGLLSNLAANETVTSVDGVRVTLTNVRLSTACGSTTNRISVALSGDGGATWTTSTQQTGNLTGSNQTFTFGSTSSMSAWPGQTWNQNAISDGRFRIRLTAAKGCATGSTQLRVDAIAVQANYTFSRTTSTWTTQSLNVLDPLDSSALASQGFWGAIFTSGGWRENGDKYGPKYIGNGTGAPSGSVSPTYDASGYDYTIELPGGSGQVQLFDPMFCATGDNGHGGSFGAGDHWTSPGNIAPVAITYRLYDTKETLLDTTDDGPPVATLTYDPGSRTMGDFSGAFGTPQNSTDGNRQDCAGNVAHNRWVQMAAGLGSGTYRLNVNTSLDPKNLNVGAENLFSIWVKSAGQARVYGGGRMAAYTNLDTGQQKFYFAQIERVHAGKTMEIHLFDPGETNGNAYLRLLSPDGNAYHYQDFTWTSDDGRSSPPGTTVTQIQTSNGSALFNNREITITIQLPNDYGQGGLNPPGDITDEDGWWLIEYQLTNGNDTTTWSVDIRGNPVHLVLP